MENRILERIATALEVIATKLGSSIVATPGLLEPTTKVGITYQQWAEKWVAQYKEPKIKVNYLKILKGYLTNYIYPAFGLVDLGDISSQRLQEFLLQIDSKATRTKCAAILSESLRKAYDTRVISFNPFPAVDFDRYEQPSLGALTHGEQLHLLETIKSKKVMGDYYDKHKIAFIYFLLCTGLRQGEALALKAKNIDFAGKKIKVTHSRERSTGELVSPKTKAGVRIVPVGDLVLDLIRPYVRKAHGGFIFPWSPDGSSRICRKMFAYAELKGSGHMLRHTFITNCYELGIPPYVIQRWAGHSEAKQADAYLALRSKDEFVKTEIVDYMLELKNTVVVSVADTT